MDKGSLLKSEPPLVQERPPSAQQTQQVADEQNISNGEEGSDEDDSDPADTIANFDWDDLHRRYHDAMNGCHGEEEALMQEWQSLMAYFRVWAQSGHDHETERTFSRLRTRSAYVKHEEEMLEQKRKHYINVVQAFENVIYLAHHPPQPLILSRKPSTNDAMPSANRPRLSSSAPIYTSSRLHIMRCSVM